MIFFSNLIIKKNLAFFHMKAEEIDVDNIIDKLLNFKAKECKLLEA